MFFPFERRVFSHIDGPVTINMMVIFIASLPAAQLFLFIALLSADNLFPRH